jgi:predicted nuclease with TOPRIM domain
MEITIKSADDLLEFLSMHRQLSEFVQDIIDPIKRKTGSVIREKAEAQKVIDDLREELRLIIEKNTQLQRTVDQLNAENELLQASINSSTQEKARLEGIIGKQEGFYQELVSKFNKVRDDLDYTKLISTKLCEVAKRHYPGFTYEQFCAEFDKEAKRVKKFNARANKEKRKWHKIFKTDHGTTHVKRTDQQSS